MQVNFPRELCEGAVSSSPSARCPGAPIPPPSTLGPGQAKPNHRQGTGGIRVGFGASCLHLYRGDRRTDREQMFIPSSHSGLTKSSFNPVFFSLYIWQICLGWYVGLTKNIEPELDLQSSIPPASACEAAMCFSVEWRGMKKQDFLHSGEDMRAFTQLYFSRLISCSNIHSCTKDRKPTCCEQ